MDENDAPVDPKAEANLRFLRRLVSVLTTVMIAGLIILIVLFVTRFPTVGTQAGLGPLPDRITLPAGAEASAVTRGDGWVAIVDRGARILIYDAASGELSQTIEIDTTPQ